MLTLRKFKFVATSGQQYLNGIVQGDINVAKSLVGGNGFSESDSGGNLKPSFHELPGYPFFLAIFLAIFGYPKGIFAVTIFQLVISSLGVFLIFELVQEVFKNKKAALISAFLWAIWGRDARQVIVPIHDALMPLLILFTVYCFAKGVMENKKNYFIFSAIVLGFTSYIRSDFILLPIFFAAALWLIKKDFFYALKWLILMWAVVFIILLPWGIRNYIQFNRFIITRTVLWQGIWEGFGEFENHFGAVLDDGATFNQIHKQYPNIVYGTPEYEDILKGKTISALKSNPLWYFEMLPKRLFLMIFSQKLIDASFLYSPTYGRGLFLENHPGQGIVQYLLWLLNEKPSELFLKIFIGTFTQLIIIILSIFAILKFWKIYKNQIIIIISPLLCAYLSHLPIYWEPRFLFPGEFPYFILASLSLVWFYYRSRGRDIVLEDAKI